MGTLKIVFWRDWVDGIDGIDGVRECGSLRSSYRCSLRAERIVLGGGAGVREKSRRRISRISCSIGVVV